MAQERIQSAALRRLVTSAENAAARIHSGMTVAFGGYTSAGYPKAIPAVLAARRAAGEDLRIHAISSSTNTPIDELLGAAGALQRRTPMFSSRLLARQANSQTLEYCEQQMNQMPRLLRSGAFGRIEVAVVEALGITADGGIIPTSAIGMEPSLLAAAEEIIVEINLSQPELLAEFHDIYLPQRPQPIPLTRTAQRIGKSCIPVPSGKIKAIVYSSGLDETTPPAPARPEQKAIAQNLFNFLELEQRRTGMHSLPPIQTGFGNLANEIVNSFSSSHFRDIEFFCGGLQAANLRLLAEGTAAAASCGSVELTPEALRLLDSCGDALRKRLVIRNGEITNNAEVISRLGPITLTSGIEMDIYGNVNSSHISGSRVVNGLGGGANFAENAGLSVLMLASEGKQGAISTIVPMVSHQDICEHDIDVVITEHGIADLRGKTDIERARTIIENCSGSYKDQLRSYFNRAAAAGGHHPILLREALSWHTALAENGTMRLE